MTHLLDTSALLAHYLGEHGAERVQALFEDEAIVPGVSILVLFEFECRLYQLEADPSRRAAVLQQYSNLLDEIVNVDAAVQAEAIQLRIKTPTRIPAIDVLIAGTASLKKATLVHRDPHFTLIPAGLLHQEVLPEK